MEIPYRYDLMAGFNGQEGSVFLHLFVFPMIAARNQSIDEGCSMEMVTEFLQGFCSQSFTTQAPELCADFIIREYGLDTAVDERQRTIRLSLFVGR